MKILRETALFFNRKWVEMLRQPVWLVGGLATPLLYMALFAPLLGNLSYPPRDTAAVLDSFVPGILTILAFGTGMGCGWLVIWEKQSGVIERLRVSPASRFSILMGTVMTTVVIFWIISLIVLAISALFGFNIHFMGLAVMLVLLSLLTTIVAAWSSSLGMIFDHIGSLASVITGLQLPLTLLSGALLPIALGPTWLRALAHINPMFYTVEASRVLAAGNINSPETILAFAVIVPLTALTLWWATGVFRKTAA